MKSGWQRKTVGELCEVVNGGTPKTGTAEYWGGEHLWITPAEMGKRVSPYVSSTERTVTDKGLQNSSANLLPPYSVILSSRAPIGHLVINAKPMATNQGCKGLVPSGAIHYTYLFYYLSSIVPLLHDLGTGATFKELSGGKLKQVSVPYPPLAEQRRIVGILDEAFAGIARAVAATEKNLANARELFESYRASALRDREAKWEPTTLGNEVELQTGFPFKSVRYTDAQDGIRLLRGDNVVPGRFRWNDVKRWPAKEAAEYDEFQLRRDDVILAMDRPWIAAGLKHAVIEDADLPCLLVQRVARLRPGRRMQPLFLKYLIGSQAFSRHVLSVQTGSGVPHISGKQIKDFAFALPPIADQRRIGERIHQADSQTQDLESLYRRKLAALAELKQSILQKAFAGELTGRSEAGEAVA